MHFRILAFLVPGMLLKCLQKLIKFRMAETSNWENWQCLWCPRGIYACHAKHAINKDKNVMDIDFCSLTLPRMHQVNAFSCNTIIIQWFLMMKVTYLGNFPLFCGPEMWPAVVPVYTVFPPIIVGLNFFLPAFTQFTERLWVAAKHSLRDRYRHSQNL